MPRNTYVRIGEAARIVGVSIESLRRWERDGKLSAVRTFGGQRTYLLSEIERLRDDNESENEEKEESDEDDDLDEEDEPSERSVRLARPARVSGQVPPWKAREANAAADLSVTRLEIERREEIRRYREEEQRRVAAQLADADARAAQMRLRSQTEAERQRQQRDLDFCLQLVRMRLTGEPSDVRAEVERFLAERARPGVSIAWIRAQADAILDRRRVERDAAVQRKREDERRSAEETLRKVTESVRLTALLTHGEAVARTLTADREEWDAPVAEEAVEEVREHLASTVETAWSEKRVEREVREVLEAWD
jgi:DNA-binding transcriptional MerR regulator